MTTMNRVIRKAEKKALRQAEKRNRKEAVEVHNLTHVQQQLMATQQKPDFKIVDDAWQSPYRSDRPATPSLKEMFFL